MVNLFRSFFLISFCTAAMGVFMVVLVHVVTDTSPDFAKLPEPASYSAEPAKG